VAHFTSEGFGKTMPTASYDTPQGRQMNRSVEIMVSVEVIGTQIGGAPTAQRR
jgi:outer membrane protein OmpA-like peptidoglycan-associated protein